MGDETRLGLQNAVYGSQMYRELWESHVSASDRQAVKMARVTHYPDGTLWPEGASRDFSAFHATRHAISVGEVAWDYRFYDPYSAYVDEGLPPGQPPQGRFTNNLAWVPSQAVLDRMVRDLESLSHEYQVLWWDSAIQCFPYVARHLKRLFRLVIMNFGDDMPGSSEIKTFPVAEHFDVLIHAMYVWDFETGKTVPEVYAEHGLPDCRFIAWGPTEADYDEEWFERKLERLRSASLPVDLLWMGGSGISLHRRKVLADLASGGIPNSHFHGNGMRDGWWEGPPSTWYAAAKFGLNVPESSLFNGRFSDLCMSGTVQLAYDPHKELERFGFQDGVSYLRFDGTPAGAMRQMAPYRGDGEALARIARCARQHFVAFRAQHDDARVQASVLSDYAVQIQQGRR